MLFRRTIGILKYANESDRALDRGLVRFSFVTTLIPWTIFERAIKKGQDSSRPHKFVPRLSDASTDCLSNVNACHGATESCGRVGALPAGEWCVASVGTAVSVWGRVAANTGCDAAANVGCAGRHGDSAPALARLTPLFLRFFSAFFRLPAGRVGQGWMIGVCFYGRTLGISSHSGRRVQTPAAQCRPPRDPGV